MQQRRSQANFPAVVRYLDKRNEGKGAALNFALPLARGEWIWFFDDDDVALPRSNQRSPVARYPRKARGQPCDQPIPVGAE